ncbi:hypothetical protein GCM10007962_15870 [Yeosuana aromativorans]|uniref:DUF916 domain-containing protein n=1 Tax=Yeosuana aromativorans TaxID=288019 RepID=A0A8J3BHI2_9FLAO|nr:hypothetical protein [Yeosuana aromativorans]GGK22505.1 hypothetical protein GCM10007962_15870 [Yeosuana aromativorans]
MRTKFIQYIVFPLVIGFLFNLSAYAQDTDLKNYRVRFGLTTVKQSDNSRVLEASFIATNKKDRKDRVPVYEADINFYNVTETEDILLGTTKTDKEGTAQLTVPANQAYVTDADGFINLKAVFDGTDGLDSEEAELAVKDVFLELNLKEIDSVKTVILNAYTLDSLNTKIPLEDTEISFTVGGFIKNLPIQKGTVEDGQLQFKFPENISGDKNGNIDVIASIVDSDEFGNVIQKKNINWGTNKIIEVESNKLWSRVAPIWMYIVLSILLLGVWANYAYSIVNLLKMKNEGKELE